MKSYLCPIEIYLTYSYFWLLLFAVLSAGAVFWFYPPKKASSVSSMPILWTKRVLRFFTLFLLLTLLLSPLLVYFQKEKEKPMVLLYLDDSGSLTMHDTTALNQFVTDWNKLAERLADAYAVSTFYFHETVQDTFSHFKGARSNLSVPLLQAHSLFKKYNPGAVVLASDGIQNSGTNPLFLSPLQDAPLLVVGLGDSSDKKDVWIKEVNHNAVVYLGNTFSCIAAIQSAGFEGKKVELSLKSEGVNIASKSLVFNANSSYQNVEFVVEAKQPGFKRYTLTVSELEGELTYKNNVKDFYVDVVDGREKIAIVYHAPHPDVQALRSALETNKNYEVLLFQASEFTENVLKDLSLVIGHQYPRINAVDKKMFATLTQRKIPFWYVLGAQSPIDLLGSVFTGLKIQRRGNAWSDAQVASNPSFSEFVLSEDLLNQWLDWPPLYTPFANFSLPPDAQILAYQSLNKVQTDYPLIAFAGKQLGHKQAFVMGEGLWRWRMKDKLKNNQSDIFDDLIKKIARSLMSKEEKRRFFVKTSKEVFDEDESVVLQGEVFDLNVEPLTGASIFITLTNEKGTKYTYTMDADGTGYILNAGVFESGYYTYEAEVKQPAAGFSKVKGGFLVKPVQIEWTESKADFPFLRELAAHNQGAFFSAQSLAEVEKAIRNNPMIKPIIKTKKNVDELLSLRSLLLFLTLLLTLEWILRKWEGGF